MATLLKIAKALIVRFFLMFHVLLCTWRVSVNMNNQIYWLLLCLLLPLVFETLYTIIKRKGNEFSRFSPCFFFYLGAVLPGIWLLELDRTDLYLAGKDPALFDPLDPKIPGQKQSIWLVVIEEMMPYVIFISRWILPRGKLTRADLAELLFSFIEIGADIMEFFALFDDSSVRGHKTLTYTVLSLWSIAVFQFTMTFTIIHQPKSESTVRVVKIVSEEEKELKRMKHEICAIFLTMFMQDLPFSITRLYVIINFNRITYSLIFFTSKNLLIIALMFYKVAILCTQRYCPGPEYFIDVKEDVRSRGDINEAEKGNVRNKGSHGGSTSQLSITSEKFDAYQHNSRTQDSGSNIIDRHSGLKKRNGKLENSNFTLNDGEQNAHGSNAGISRSQASPLPKPHKLYRKQNGPAEFVPITPHDFLPDRHKSRRVQADNISHASSNKAGGTPEKDHVLDARDVHKNKVNDGTEQGEHATVYNNRTWRRPRKKDSEAQREETYDRSFNSQSSSSSLLSSEKSYNSKDGTTPEQTIEQARRDTANPKSRVKPETKHRETAYPKPRVKPETKHIDTSYPKSRTKPESKDREPSYEKKKTSKDISKVIPHQTSSNTPEGIHKQSRSETSKPSLEHTPQEHSHQTTKNTHRQARSRSPNVRRNSENNVVDSNSNSAHDSNSSDTKQKSAVSRPQVTMISF